MTTIKDIYEGSRVTGDVKEITPSAIQEAREIVEHTGSAAKALFVAAKDAHFFNEEELTDEMQSLYDTTFKVANINKGILGYFLGMVVYTDSVFPPEKQFITGTRVVNYHSDLETSFDNLEAV